jgi:hypothetical protein
MLMERKMNKFEDEAYKVLRWIFDKAKEKGTNFVVLRDFLKENGEYDEASLSEISDYLEGEGLVNHPSTEDSLFMVELTHKGKKEIIRSIENPGESTEHFPNTVIQNFNFNAPVGAVQQGDNNVANVQQNFGTNTEDVLKLLRGLQDHLPDENKQYGLELIEGLEAEVKSEKPSESRMKLYLKGLGEVVKETGKSLLIEVGKKVISGEISLG